jgi:alpha-mannosidase
MSADELIVTSTGPVLGEMVCRGRLMDREGRRVAGFRQTTRAWRGSRVLELAIELDIDRQPGPNPWDSYYAVRFAWKDETASLYRSVNLANLPTELTQIESPHFLDIRRAKQRTTLLCGGLPFHRRFGPRKLDTLLVVQGETARSFRLGIGIDVPHPMPAALGFLSPPLMLPDQPPPPTTSGWLFHLNCRNVLATHWEPLSHCDESFSSRRNDGSGGFRLRLLETDGLGVQLGLRSFRTVASAKKINPGDVPSVKLEVVGDRVNIPIGPHQWIEVEVLFIDPR